MRLRVLRQLAQRRQSYLLTSTEHDNFRSSPPACGRPSGATRRPGKSLAIEANDDVFIFNATGFRRAVCITRAMGAREVDRPKPSARSLVNSIISTQASLGDPTSLELRNNIMAMSMGMAKLTP